MGTMHSPGDFEGIGLTGPEQVAYAALVDMSPATVADLQHATAGDDTHQLALVLDSLEALGLITRVPGTPARYTAIDPEMALELLIIGREEQLRRARLAAQRLATRFRDRVSRRDPAELIEIVTGADAAARRIQQIQRGAREEFRFIDKPPYLLPAGVLSDTEVEQLDRDVRYRGIYDPAGLPTHDLAGDMEQTLSRGEEARMLAHAPIKLLLVDDRYACLPLQADPEELISIVVVHPSGLLEALSALFEALWKRAMPSPPHGQDDLSAPTEDERRLLTMLTAGVPDRAAAKQLGVSPRTYQRRIQDLMTQLEAETRFQAGLAAGMRGWITKR
jgi:hypothetical protein